MDAAILFSKTGKGLLELETPSGILSTELRELLRLVHQDQALTELREKLGNVSEEIFSGQLRQLSEGGFIEAVAQSSPEGEPILAQVPQQFTENDDLDFTEVLGKPGEGETSPGRGGGSEQALGPSLEARAKRDQETSTSLAVLADARLEAESRAREEAEIRARQEAGLRLLLADEAEARLAEEKTARERAERALEEERERWRLEEEARKLREAQQAREKEEEQARKLQEEERARKREEEELARRQQAEEDLRKALEAQEQRIKAEEQKRLAAEAAEREALERAARQAQAVAEEARRVKLEREREEREEAAQRAREQAERKAKEAEERKRSEEEARRRAEVARLTHERRMREEALAKQREQQAERDRQAAARKALLEQNRKTPWKRAKPVLIALLVLLLGAVALLQFMPVAFLIPVFEGRASRQIGEPVSIGELNMSVVPRLQFRLSDMKIGVQFDVRAKAVTVYPAWDSLLGGPFVIEKMVVEEVSAGADALPRIAAWGSRIGGVGDLKVERVHFQQALLAVKGVEVPAFDGDLAFTPEGRIAGASLRLSDGTLRAEMDVAGASVEVAGRGFTLPYGPAVVFDEVSASGSITSGGINLSSIDGQMYGGHVKGNANLRWDEGWSLTGEFQLQRVQLFSLMQTVGKVIKASGQMDAAARFEMRAATIGRLFEAPAVQSTFSIANGSLDGVDLILALRSQVRDGVRGGKTRFDTLAGTLSVSDNRYQYRDLKLASGLFKATGALDILPSRELAGRMSMELRSPSGEYRNSYSLAGNLESIVFRY